jgi:hypothetical protein
MNTPLKLATIKVIKAFDTLDPLISVNDEPACTRCRELCHAVDELWAIVCPDYPRYDEFNKRRKPAKR